MEESADAPHKEVALLRRCIVGNIRAVAGCCRCRRYRLRFASCMTRRSQGMIGQQHEEVIDDAFARLETIATEKKTKRDAAIPSQTPRTAEDFALITRESVKRVIDELLSGSGQN